MHFVFKPILKRHQKGFPKKMTTAHTLNYIAFANIELSLNKRFNRNKILF